MASSAALACTVPIRSAFLRSRYTPHRGLITSRGRFMRQKIVRAGRESESQKRNGQALGSALGRSQGASYPRGRGCAIIGRLMRRQRGWWRLGLSASGAPLTAHPVGGRLFGQGRRDGTGGKEPRSAHASPASRGSRSDEMMQISWARQSGKCRKPGTMLIVCLIARLRRSAENLVAGSVAAQRGAA
jgi:hypothetical protein